MRRLLTLAVLLLLSLGTALGQVPAHKRVYLVMLENHSYEDVVGSAAMPYLNSLIAQGALTDNMFGNAHPSIGNYFMLTTGELITQESGFSATVSVRNLVRVLRGAGKDWVAYAQSLPARGYTGGNSGAYAQRHNPFAYFSDVRNDPAEAAKLHPLTDWDPAAPQPEFVYLLPDNANNGHDCPAGMSSCTDADKQRVADQWLSTYVKPLVESGALADGGLLIVGWDEGKGSDQRNGGGRIANVFVGPQVKAGWRSATFYQQEHLLNTLLAALGVSADMGVTKYEKKAMDDMFGAPLPPPPPVCVAPTSNGVAVCAPANNSTVASPVQLRAAAYSTAGIRYMQVYVDGKKFQDYIGQSIIDVAVPMAVGATHRVTVQAGDANNVLYKQTVYVTVQ